MQTVRRTLLVIAATVVSLCSSMQHAKADIVLAIGSPTLQAPSGGKQRVDVNIFAYSSSGAGDLVSGFSFNVNVSGPGTITLLNTPAPTAATSAPWNAITQNAPTIAGTSITFSGKGTFPPFVPFSTSIDNNTSNQIGSFSFEVNTNGTFNLTSSANAFTLSNSVPVSGFGVETGTTTGNSITTSFGSAPVTITALASAIPEPTSFAMMGLVIGGFAIRRRFRKQSA